MAILVYVCFQKEKGKEKSKPILVVLFFCSILANSVGENVTDKRNL